MKDEITVSVLMAVKDTDFALIKRAIDSVLNQNFQNFEFIIIDGGSRDDSSNQIHNYSKIHKDKIIYIHHKNCGQSQSINRGVLNSCGKYISMLDADDEYKPNHLTACILEMESVDLIASNTLTIVDKPEDYFVPDKHDPSKLIHVDDCILFATLFGKREAFKSLAFETMYAADALFFETISKKYKTKKVNLRSYIYYRNIPNSVSAKLKELHKNPLG